MKAYVIDQDQLKQYIIIAVTALVLSFVFGYIVGDDQHGFSQKASTKIIDTSATDIATPLAIKKDDNVLAAKTEKKTIQKDLKKAKLEKKEEVTKKTAQKNKVVVKKASTKKPVITKTKKTVIQKKTIEKKSAPKKSKLEAAAVSTVSAEGKSTKEATAAETKPSGALVQDKKQKQVGNKRLYSIQAGMFASRTNADSFIEKLAVEKFDAYVSDFVSTSGAVKYNVRVGRFDERDKAREKLKKYQKFFSSPAYVVISQ